MEPRRCIYCKCVVTIQDGSPADGALRNGAAMVKRETVDAKGKPAWVFDLFCSPECWSQRLKVGEC